MEMLTRLVSESLARHGFDRPLDYRRLQWSRWFRCESHHSLLCVPSKPGVFALAEEILDLGNESKPERREFSRSEGGNQDAAALPINGLPAGREERAEVMTEAVKQGANVRRMLAVTQFFEDDDMAFVLDRMLSRNNPMRARLESGRYFVRFVEIHDQGQRRSICNALNQWIASSAEKATGIGGHFATSLELTPATEQTKVNASVGRTLPCANHELGTHQKSIPEASRAKNMTPLEAVTATTVQRIPLFPSGF